MRKNSTRSRDSEPLVSVIVPAYNSEKTIRACLDSIIAQKTKAFYDVTVVDSSTDETPRIIMRDYPSVRLIHLDNRTYAGTARNIGVRATRGRLCMMIDSDCIAEPGLIEGVVARHGHGKYAAVGGAVCNGTPASWSGLLCYLLEFKEFMPSTPERLVTSIPTANITYRRESFERHGGFDDSMRLAEDILFNWKLHQSGERILFDPRLKVNHLNRTGWKNVLSYQSGMGSYSAKARRLGGLPGTIMLRHPVLVLLLPLGRLFRAIKWLAEYDRSCLLRFLPVTPMYLLATTIWSAGFLREVLKESHPVF
ncbi:MAG TPA: glycosyltransferase [Blastocatellia bacterium]|nr:glycosyltransferase [Blastocatellia bacterium]